MKDIKVVPCISCKEFFQVDIRMKGDYMCWPCVDAEGSNKSSKGKQNSGGTKHDSDKVQMELLPYYPLWAIANVLTFGAKKYAPWNWTKGFNYSRLQGAALRHLGAWSSGEDKDPESKMSHLWHAACCLVFLIWMEKFRPDLDDRFKDPQ